MKTYWDLSFNKRAALSADEVNRYCDIQLMVNGILKPTKPQLLSVEPVAIPKQSVYVLEVEGDYGNRQRLEIAFANINDARAFLDLNPLRIRRPYNEPEHITPFADDAAVVQAFIPTREDAAPFAGAANKAKQARETNERAQKQYEQDLAAVEKATEDIRKDWQAQQDVVRRIGEVKNVWSQYTAMAGGDRYVARTFLLKAFQPETFECRVEDGNPSGLVDLVQEAIGDEGKVFGPEVQS